MTTDQRQKIKDVLTLHLPLVLVLALCTVATVIEYGRAQEGVGRAWAYTFQWPIIGLFAIVIWNRYRKHGSLTRWFTDRYRNRIAAFTAEAEAAEAAETAKEPEPIDPDEQAWAEYVADLRRRDEQGR